MNMGGGPKGELILVIGLEFPAEQHLPHHPIFKERTW